MAQAKPVLYSYFRSSCAWRVRIALALKGIDYEYRAVNLLNGDQHKEDFKKINPLGEVPVLVHQGNVIAQSVPIMEYLDELYPSPPLLPTDPASRAKVRIFVNTIVSGIQPLQNLNVLKKVQDDPAAWAVSWIERGFKALETQLSSVHGKYCFGDVITMADLCLVPQVFNAKRFNVDMSQFPLISEINDRLNEHKAFKDSHPLVQPDCPEDAK